MHSDMPLYHESSQDERRRIRNVEIEDKFKYFSVLERTADGYSVTKEAN